MRILLIGAGAIGSRLVTAVDAMDDVTRVLVLDERRDVAEAACRRSKKCAVARDFESALHESDLVVEAASQEAVAQMGPHALRAGRDLVVVSVGALANDALREELVREARAANRRIHVPSGAIGGLDLVKAAKEARVDAVRLTTAKPPASLGGHYATDATGPLTLFEGPAREAVKQFPKNVNVAAALSLAGVGMDETRVTLDVDPSLDKNTHRIDVEGEFGSARVEVRNNPSPDNPATSHLAALSVIALVRRLVSPLQVGT